MVERERRKREKGGRGGNDKIWKGRKRKKGEREEGGRGEKNKGREGREGKEERMGRKRGKERGEKRDWSEQSTLMLNTSVCVRTCMQCTKQEAGNHVTMSATCSSSLRYRLMMTTEKIETVQRMQPSCVQCCSLINVQQYLYLKITFTNSSWCFTPTTATGGPILPYTH